MTNYWVKKTSYLEKSPATGVVTSYWIKMAKIFTGAWLTVVVVVSALKGIGFVHHRGLKHIVPNQRAGIQWFRPGDCSQSVSSRKQPAPPIKKKGEDSLWTSGARVKVSH